MHSSSVPFRPWRPTPGSGARSSEVRVSYFDPETGEPLGERKRDPSPRRRTKRGLVLETEFAAKPVVVDGVRYASINEAAKAAGGSRSALGKALARGDAEYRGHSVAYAPGEGAE